MNQKFVLKYPKYNRYFSSINIQDGNPDVEVTDVKYEAKIFDSILEAKVWIKRIRSNDMTYIKNDENPIWEIVLVNMKNGINDFDEVLTWYSTTEE